MRDVYNREIDYMRISVTNRCNFRCKYCMPEVKKTRDPLSLDDIYEVALVATKCGISKFKITGGEPLIREGIADFIEKLHKTPNVKDITMTTNGFYLKDYAKALVDAGLSSVNVSLDSLDKEKFKNITGADALEDVISGIQKAIDVGIKTKINTVLQRDINDNELFDILELAKNMAVDIRFIEMMPIGHGRNSTGISNDEVLKRIQEKYGDIEEEKKRHGNGPAKYIKIGGFAGAIGFIGAVHNKFCESCNRIRFTSTGLLKPCLCFNSNIDLKDILYDTSLDEGEKREKLMECIRECIICKPRSHVFEDISKVSEQKDMSEIGG